MSYFKNVFLIKIHALIIFRSFLPYLLYPLSLLHFFPLFPFNLVCFQARLEKFPVLREWSVRSWCLFKVDVSCVGTESDRELGSAAVSLPTLEMSYVNSISFMRQCEKLLIDVLWKWGKWDLQTTEKHMGVERDWKANVAYPLLSCWSFFKSSSSFFLSSSSFFVSWR